MKAVKTKSGGVYYYGKNGKRISKSEYQRRLKISLALKGRKAKAGTKAFRPTSKKRQSSWVKTSHKGKNGIIEGLQRDWPVNSGWVDSIDELLPLMLEVTEDIIRDIKQSDIKSKFVSFGYHFSVQYENSTGVHEFTNVGYSPRININKKVGQLLDQIDIAMDDISDRFVGYLQREASSLVKLNYITVEQLIREKKNKKSARRK